MSNSPISSNWFIRLRRGITDLWFLLWVIVAALILVLLLSYHSSDPGWSTSGTSDVVKNWLGVPGAYVSDFLISIFGYAGYLLPLGLVAIGWQSVKKEYLEPEKMVWKNVFLFAAEVMLCGIFTFHWPVEINSWAVTAGGIVGQKLTMMLLSILNNHVSWVMSIYSILFLLSITAVFNIHWVKFFETIGRPLWWLIHILLALIIPGDKQKVANVTPEKTPATERRRLRDRLAPGKAQRGEPSLSLIDEGQDDSIEFAEPTKTKNTLWQKEQKPSYTLDKGFTAVRKDFPNIGLEEEMLNFSAGSIEANKEELPNNLFADYDAFPAAKGIATEKEEMFSQEPQLSEMPAVFRPIAPIDESLAAIQGDDDEDGEEEDLKTSISPLKVNLFANSLFSNNTPNEEVERVYQLPPLDLLEEAPMSVKSFSLEEQQIMAQKVEEALKNYRLDVNVVNVEVGPVVTRLELDLAPGIKVSQISNLDKDLARSLAVQSVRVVEVIPGRPFIGLEIPNRKREIVHLRNILESDAYQSQKSPLTIVLGDDISGNPVVANLGKMPHLLVAGTTGSGKSVAINVMLASMLYKAKPDQLRLILIDPKMLEMSMYEDIPHLLTPVVTDMNDAENALRWAVAEMERRYQLMAAFKVRNIAGFNSLIRELQIAGERIDDPTWKAEENLGIAHQPPQIEPLPNIVIVIDELADMMMAVGKKVEELIARIAQKARAAGIHLILATQRPSVDVITGLIKANVPTRLAFQVSSKIDSRTIIDQQGADALLGYGDGLFVPPGSSAPQRVHGAFIEDKEVEALANFVKSQGQPDYVDSITNPIPASAMGAYGAGEKSDDPELDPLYDEACQMVIESNKASISWLQRRLSIGYNRSARIIETMERAGIVSSPDHGIRKVLIGRDQQTD